MRTVTQFNIGSAGFIIALSLTVYSAPSGLSAPVTQGLDTASYPFGHWARSDGKANVRLESCGTDLCAVNIWIRPDDHDEKVGDKLIMSLKPQAPRTWSGTAYDPQRNLHYKMTLVAAAQSMTTRGCVFGGLICKSVSWSRIG